MFRIAICDDESIFREQFKEILQKYMDERGRTYEIDTFSSGKEFIEQGIEMVKYKIVFLDINMEELDGIMTAKKIRENSRDMFIVFITAFINYTLEGYKVDAIRYILKEEKGMERVGYNARNRKCDGASKAVYNRCIVYSVRCTVYGVMRCAQCLMCYALRAMCDV